MRELSPFTGIIRVIETKQAQASTHNGRDWRLLVRVFNPVQQGGSLEAPNQARTILYGFWSRKNGLKTVPLSPLVDPKQIGFSVRELLHALPESTTRAPFPLRDTIELWLLHEKTRLPLALLAACRDRKHLPDIRKPVWEATRRNDHSFISPSLMAQQKGENPAYLSRDSLTTLVNRTAGQTASAQWFARQADGSGEGLAGIHLEPALQQRRLAASDFPELLLWEDWDDEQARQLVDDYIAWQAPWLLTLPTLSPASRQRLEPLAFEHALKVQGLYHLYPDVIDKARLKAVLVEATMRRSHPQADTIKE